MEQLGPTLTEEAVLGTDTLDSETDTSYSNQDPSSATDERGSERTHMLPKRTPPIPTDLRFALDCGKRKFHISDANGKVREYDSAIKAIRYTPRGATIVAERSMENYDYVAYNAALVLAAKRGITLQACSTHAVKNWRRDNNIPYEDKTDAADALALWQIYFNSAPRATGIFKPRSPQPDPVVNARIRGWAAEEAWLVAHGIPKQHQYVVFASGLVLGKTVVAGGGTRGDFDKVALLSDLGHPSLHRSNGMKWALSDHPPKAERKSRLREINRTLRHIFALVRQEEGGARSPGTDTHASETDTFNSNRKIVPPLFYRKPSTSGRHAACSI